MKHAQKAKESLQKQAFSLIVDTALHARDLPDACDRVLTGLLTILPFDCGEFYLLGSDGTSLTPIRVIDPDPESPGSLSEPAPLESPQHLCAWVAREKKMVACSDIARSARWKNLERLRQEKVRSILSGPVIGTKGSLVGVVQFWSKIRLRIEKEHRSLLKTVLEDLAGVLERLRDRAALQDRQEFLCAVINTSPEAAIVLGEDERILLANPAAHRMFGFPRNELIGDTLDAILPGKFLGINRHYMEQYFLTGTVLGLIGIPMEVQAVRKDGTRLFLEILLTEGHAGSKRFILATLRDKTEQKRYEDSLFAERQRLLSLLEMMPASITLLAADHTIRFANRCFRENFGDPEGRPCFDLMYGRSEPCRLCRPRQVFQNGRPVNFIVRREDGRAYRFYDYPFTDMDGTSLVLEMGIEITDLTQAEDALRTSEILARSQFMNLPLPTYTWKQADDDFKLVDFNHAAFRFTEGLIADLLGSRLSDLHQNRPEIQEDIRQCFQTRSTIKKQMPFKFRSMEEDRILMVYYGYVPPDRVVVHTEDITEQIRIDQELQAALAAAREADMLKTRFLANMSHEIRTPLNAINGLATIMLIQSQLSEDKKRNYLEIIKKSGESLLAMIDQIIDLAKIESGKLEARMISFDLHEMIHGLKERYQAQAAARCLEFRFFMEDQIPKDVIGEPVMLEQVLNNLVGNAIKFTRNGFVGLAIRREKCARKTMKLKFRIEDSGIGIPDEQRELIFKSFYQVDGASTREYGGAGLGLAITKDLVATMQGEIDFTSTLGKGSTFTFTCLLFPRSVGDGDEDSQEEPN